MIYYTLFETMMPVTICIGIGYLWALLKRPFDTGFISDLVINIGAPCLVLSSLLGVELETSTIVDVIIACVLVMAIVGIIASVSLLVTSQDLRVYLPSMLFGNIGNMGLPICLFAFGKQGLALAAAYFTTVSVVMFTLGVVISQADKRANYFQMVMQPVIISTVAALCIKTTGTDLPLWLMRPIQLMGEVTIPLMLLALGVSLKQLKWSDFSRSLFFGTARILLGLGAAVTVVWMLDITGLTRGVIIIQSAMPVAVFNYLFAVRYNRSPEQVAGIVVFSTLVSFVLLPMILSFLI